jgi:hypothetical protein
MRSFPVLPPVSHLRRLFFSVWTELTPTKLGAIIALLRSSSPLGTETIQRLFFFTAVFGQIQEILEGSW